jgi:nitroreductase
MNYMNKIQKVRKYGPKIIARSFLWPINILFKMSFFYPEYKAVEKGIRAYNRNNQYSIETKLRRNIHRLEKGLINKDPKSVFGLAYISETISSFKIVHNTKPNSDSIIWAEDILSLYFQTIDYRSNQITLGAYKDFTDFCKKNQVEISGRYHPYEVSIREKSNIKPEHLQRLFQQRRSIRSYTSKKVDRSIIEKALDMGLQAPSGCNRQPFEFQIIDNDSLLEKVSMIPPGSTSFAGKAPAMIFVLGNLNAYYDEKDRHMIYIDSAMAVMSFILALESFGVSSCVINFPEERFVENKLRKEIKMEPYQKCIMALTIGYPSNELLIPSSMKKSVSSVIKYN